MILGSIAFGIAYLLIAVRRLRWLRIDRASGAIIGAVLAVAIGSVTPEEAAPAIDHSTLVLLLGVMGIGAFLSIDGFFDRAAAALVGARTDAWSASSPPSCGGQAGSPRSSRTTRCACSPHRSSCAGSCAGSCRACRSCSPSRPPPTPGASRRSWEPPEHALREPREAALRPVRASHATGRDPRLAATTPSSPRVPAEPRGGPPERGGRRTILTRGSMVTLASSRGRSSSTSRGRT